MINEHTSNCYCNTTYYNKFKPNTSDPKTIQSDKMKIASMIRNKKGGTTNFGNFYLGEPLTLNYLGNSPGMPGGSGRPPTNQF